MPRTISLLVGLAVAVLGVVVPLTLLSRLGGNQYPVQPAGSIGSPVVMERIPVESGVEAVAVGEEGVWVAGFNRVARIDPTTNQVSATIRTPGAGDYSEVAVGEGSVWVTASRLVYRIDPAENAVTATIEVGEYPQDIAVAGGWVWVTRAMAGPGDLVRIDPSINRVAGGPIALGYGPGPGPGPFAYHDDALWVLNTGLTVGELTEPVEFDGPTMARVDIATGEVSRSLSSLTDSAPTSCGTAPLARIGAAPSKSRHGGLQSRAMTQEMPELWQAYRIRSKATGYELATSTVGGNHVVPRPPGQGDRWVIKQAPYIPYTFVTTYTFEMRHPGGWGLRLDSNFERQVYAIGANDGNFQKWQLIPDGEDYWVLRNGATSS